MTEPDLTTPSFAAAYRLSRLRAACGDRDGATQLFSRLLWHVEANDGGFIGLSDEQLAEKCESDKRLNHAIATAAMYAPEPWPVIEQDSGPLQGSGDVLRQRRAASTQRLPAKVPNAVLPPSGEASDKVQVPPISL